MRHRITHFNMLHCDPLERRTLLAGSIGGTVSIANGAQNLVAPHFTLYADLDSDDFADPTEPHTFADGLGRYTLTDVPAGDRPLRVVLANGLFQTESPLVHVVEGEETLQNLRIAEERVVSNVLIHDRNGDADLDPAEPPLQGWTVYADRNSDGQLSPGDESVLTDADGRYTFTFRSLTLPQIRTVVPAGWRLSKTSTNFYSQGGIIRVTAQTYARNVTGGRVYLDLDLDGVRDTSEPSLLTSGISVQFGALANGIYRVRYESDLYFGPTSGTPAYFEVNIFNQNASGTVAFELNSMMPSSTQVSFFWDNNGNSVQDWNESTLTGNGWIDLDNDRIIDSGESGTLSFSILPGYYTAFGTGGSRDLYVPPLGTGTAIVPMAAAAPGTPIEFSGRVFDDADLDGFQDTNEGWLSNVRVFIDYDGDRQVDYNDDVVLTDADGRFTLFDTSYGQAVYWLRLDLTAGWFQTSPGGGSGYGTFALREPEPGSQIFGVGRDVPPGVSRVDQQQSADHRVTFWFSQDVIDSVTLSDFELVQRSSGQMVDLAGARLEAVRDAAGNNGVSLILSDAAHRLANGRYLLKLNTANVANAFGVFGTNVVISTDVAELAGDVDGNGAVGFDDLIVLAQRYGTVGNTYRTGNINYSADGVVDFDDLLTLAQHYGTSLGISAAASKPIASHRQRHLLLLD